MFESPGSEKSDVLFFLETKNFNIQSSAKEIHAIILLFF